MSVGFTRNEDKVVKAALFQFISETGPDLREGMLGSCPGPPQLRDHHKTVKNYYLRKHKSTF